MSELAVQRKITKGFIAAQPVMITLVPRAQVKQPSGGTRWENGEPRVAQTMKIIEPTLGVGNTRPTVAVDGIERVVEYILLGAWDAVIGVYDTFEHDGGRWEVVQLIHDNGYEQRASVARHG